jgi:class 3 adenylate cyclase
MGFVNDLENQVKDYLDGDYEIAEITSIPSVDNVSFKKKAKKMKLCAYSIDLRKSSDLLFKHRKQTSGKIHKAFLTIVSKVAQKYGGKIRSFQGDSILVFWPGAYKQQITDAVKAAMVTKWFLDIEFSKFFEKYEKLDFGIGIDLGEVYILRAGISRDDNNNDLVFIGKCVNFAVAIANQARSPDHVEISKYVYDNLLDERKYDKNGNNMWRDGTVKWNGIKHQTKITSYYTYLKR